MLKVQLHTPSATNVPERRAGETMVAYAARAAEQRDALASVVHAAALNQFRERVLAAALLEDEAGLHCVRGIIREMCAEGLLDEHREADMLASARFVPPT